MFDIKNSIKDRTVFSEYYQEQNSLFRIVSRTDSFLRTGILGQLFVTLIFGERNPEGIENYKNVRKDLYKLLRQELCIKVCVSRTVLVSEEEEIEETGRKKIQLVLTRFFVGISM